MKAIVLSCDKYHFAADHMVRCYNSVWPEHPFVFRVPCQNLPSKYFQGLTSQVEFIHSAQDIKSTALTLVEDLPDDEWVYWCIDDKYPISINIPAATAVYRHLTETSDPSIRGMMFCRCRKLLEISNLRSDSEFIVEPELVMIERKNFYQFWIHQFVRVSVLRELFSEFPDRHFQAKEMDTFTGQNEGLRVKPFKHGLKMFVTLRNFAQFGESTVQGKLTRNCLLSMRRKNLLPPSTLELCEAIIETDEIDPSWSA